jgi:hypothetical protein
MRRSIMLSFATMLAATPALAQIGPSGQPGAGTTPTEQMQPGTAPSVQLPKGTTSGPAAGRPTTMGTGGQTTATKHMRQTLRNRGGTTTKGEHEGQAGGTAAQPGESDAGSGTRSPPPTPK